LPIDVPHISDLGSAIKPDSEVFINIRPEVTIADKRSIVDFSFVNDPFIWLREIKQTLMVNQTLMKFPISGATTVLFQRRAQIGLLQVLQFEQLH
jgi:hypothetical protein